MAASALAVVALVFGLRGVFGELQDTLNRMWNVSHAELRPIITGDRERHDRTLDMWIDAYLRS